MAGHLVAAGYVGEVIGAYERVGPSAWRLAMSIVDDERAAADIVFTAFTSSRPAPRSAADDAHLLIDVRRRAIAAGHTRGPCRVGTDAARMREAVGALSEPQRSVIELAQFGGLSVTAIASATRTPRREVQTLIVEALRALRITLDRESAAP